jgi:hypothetical protein
MSISFSNFKELHYYFSMELSFITIICLLQCIQTASWGGRIGWAKKCTLSTESFEAFDLYAFVDGWIISRFISGWLAKRRGGLVL